MTQADVARMLVNRSARLQRLLELDAPQLVVERERRLVENALRLWPVIDRGAHDDADRELTGGAH